MPSDRPIDPNLRIMPLPDWFKNFMRRYCTELGLHRHCGFKACARAGACATRDVMCYQILREPMNERLRPVVRAALARQGLLPPLKDA